ncbi:hypothetical protein ABFS83_05G060100 [Erythranthe nasuta]
MERERFLQMNGNGGEFLHAGTVRSSSPSRSVPISSPPHAANGAGVNGGVNYILHTVSKFDTLAGVAIKYGVEVADIKKLNGLVTDLQIFALKTIQIPLPGRHPPSPSLCNGHGTPPRPSNSQQIESNRRHSDLFDSFPSLKLKSSSAQKVSPAMSTLQGYYGLKPPADQKGAAEGFEMSSYRKGGAHYLEDGPFVESSHISNPPLSQHRKSKSAANCLMLENIDLTDKDVDNSSDSSKWIEKLMKQHRKSDAIFSSPTPEKLLKENTTTPISAITGKGLALRPKSGNRTVAVNGGEAGKLNLIPTGSGDSSLVTDNSVNGVRKSSSTSCLEDSDNGASSSIWPTSMWGMKTDFQALSTSSITRPIFDGLPRPANRRNKAALD